MFIQLRSVIRNDRSLNFTDDHDEDEVHDKKWEIKAMIKSGADFDRKLKIVWSVSVRIHFFLLLLYSL